MLKLPRAVKFGAAIGIPLNHPGKRDKDTLVSNQGISFAPQAQRYPV